MNMRRSDLIFDNEYTCAGKMASYYCNSHNDSFCYTVSNIAVGDIKKQWARTQAAMALP